MEMKDAVTLEDIQEADTRLKEAVKQDILSFLEAALDEATFNEIKENVTHTTSIVFPEGSLRGVESIPPWVKTSPFVEPGKYIIRNH